MLTNGDRDIRLVTSCDVKMSLDFELALELSTNRLREALALLRTIDNGELLAKVPTGDAGPSHRLAVSLLSVLEREITGVIAAQDELLKTPRPTAVSRK